MISINVLFLNAMTMIINLICPSYSVIYVFLAKISAFQLRMVAWLHVGIGFRA